MYDDVRSRWMIMIQTLIVLTPTLSLSLSLSLTHTHTHTLFSTSDTRTLVNWVRNVVTPWDPGREHSKHEGGEHVLQHMLQPDAREDALPEGIDDRDEAECTNLQKR